MLEFIKKYRNSPKRTVITLSMVDSISVNRQGDLRRAKRSLLESEAQKNDHERTAFADLSCECSCDGEMHEKEGLNSGKSADGGDLHAFKISEHCECEGTGEKGAEGSQCTDTFGASKCKSGYLSYPCGKMEIKGGLRIKKTVRILLCDLVACAVVSSMACRAMSKMLKK